MTTRRFTRGDAAFFAAFGVYTLAAVGILLVGVGAAVASVDKGWATRLALWGLAADQRGRIAEAMLRASTHTQPAYQLAIDYLFSVFNLVLAGFLLWLRPYEPTARRLAVGVVGTAAVFNLQAHGVYEAMNTTRLVSNGHDIFQLIAAISYVYALLRFPDGNLVPHWPRWALALLYGPLSIAVGVLAFNVHTTSRTIVLILYFGLLTPLAGVLGQAYRYRRSPSAIERQQSRLVFWAMVPALLVSLVALTKGIQSSAFTSFQNRPIDVIPVALFRVFQPVFALIPVALFVGILRYRLWNIDRVISRALVYSMLAGFVTAVYVAVVVGIGRLVGQQGNGNLALSIVATGIVALAFQSVRERVNRLANRLVYGKRATPYEVLSELGARMSTTVATEELLPLLARIVAEGTGATRADVWLVRGERAWAAASWPHDENASRDAVELGTGSSFPIVAGASALVPVRHDEELLGALTVTKPGSEQLSPTEDKLLQDVGAQAGLVLRNVRLTTELIDRLEELRASRQRLVAAQDEERRRLERNLHDGAQQQLVALKVQLGLAERLAEAGQPLTEMLAQLKDDTGEALENLRDLARGIYPPLLAAEGLPAAVAAHARKAAVEVEVEAEGVGRYPQDVETAVYFCVLEAIQNSSKYGGQCHVTVAIGQADHHLVFTVADDGPGFDPATTKPGAGTQNMADRVAALDGTLTIDSAPGQGTNVTGRIPSARLDEQALADAAS